jgi:hypothetical protein
VIDYQLSREGDVEIALQQLIADLLPERRMRSKFPPGVPCSLAETISPTPTVNAGIMSNQKPRRFDR